VGEGPWEAMEGGGQRRGEGLAGAARRASAPAHPADPPARRPRPVPAASLPTPPQAIKASKTDRSAGPRVGKMPPLQDFQFYDVKRLTELFEKDAAAEVFKQQREQAAREAQKVGGRGGRGGGGVGGGRKQRRRGRGGGDAGELRAGLELPRR
jgi:hypothetical protein